MKEVLDIKIAVIILNILLLLTLGILVLFAAMINRLANDVANPRLYPCKTLYIMINFNQDEDIIVTDFSLYETKKIITQIINVKEPPANENEKFRDGKVAVLSPATVYEVEGKYLWEY